MDPSIYVVVQYIQAMVSYIDASDLATRLCCHGPVFALERACDDLYVAEKERNAARNNLLAVLPGVSLDELDARAHYEWKLDLAGELNEDERIAYAVEFVG